MLHHSLGPQSVAEPQRALSDTARVLRLVALGSSPAAVEYRQAGSDPIAACRVRAQSLPGSLPHGIVRRAQIILQSADGHSNRSIRQSLGVSNATITQWRREFSLHGLAGLYDAPRSGRPRTHDDDEVAIMLRTVLETRPKDSPPMRTAMR